MDFNYEEYEVKCNEIRNANKELLDLFAADLNDFTPKTVAGHVNNVGLYIDDYLLYEEPLTFDNGIGMVDDFLGYYFIRKCAWSTPGTIRSTASSIKKFYKCMLDHGKIQKKEYDYLCEEIKKGLPKWQEDCARYNDFEEEFFW